MGWRKFRNREEIRRGVVIRIGLIEDWGTAVIIHDDRGDDVTVSRPMAYAHEHFNSKTGMLTHEVFDVSINSMLKETTDIMVYEDLKGQLRTMMT